MITIAVANQKGGVGKTTTAVTLAHGLALRNRKTLVLDLDPQGHVALSLGLEKSPGLYSLLVEEEPLGKVVTIARKDLWIVPGDKRTEKAVRYLTSTNYRETVIQSALLDANYDACLLDLAPSLNVLHIAALAASDFVIIPTRLDAMALDGVNEILRTVAEITRQGGGIQGYAIIPTFFDRVTRETVTQFQALISSYPDNTWPPIPQDVKAREAAAYGQTLWEYAPNSAALLGYSSTNGHRNGGYAQVLDQLIEGVLYGS